MTVATNNNKLDTHPLAKLVCGNLDNRTLVGTVLVCRAWRDNRDMIQARMAAAEMVLGVRLQRINLTEVHEDLSALVQDWGSIPAALKIMRKMKAVDRAQNYKRIG